MRTEILVPLLCSCLRCAHFFSCVQNTFSIVGIFWTTTCYYFARKMRWNVQTIDSFRSFLSLWSLYCRMWILPYYCWTQCCIMLYAHLNSLISGIDLRIRKSIRWFRKWLSLRHLLNVASPLTIMLVKNTTKRHSIWDLNMIFSVVLRHWRFPYLT